MPIYCSSGTPFDFVGAGETSAGATGDIGRKALDNSAQLDRFLAGIQGKAYRMARIATGNDADALDLVQDAMFKLVEKYHHNPADEWQPLFYRILHSRINDWHRRNKVRNRFRTWLTGKEEEDEDPIQTARDEHAASPEQQLQTSTSMEQLQKVLESLPPRQQQAFLLRAWEGLDVKQTAQVMSCAEGSVKTHYSRAIHALREKLGEHWP